MAYDQPYRWTDFNEALKPRLGMRMLSTPARRTAEAGLKGAAMAGGLMAGLGPTGIGAVPGMLSTVTDTPMQSAFSGVNDTGLNVLNTAQQWQRRGQAMVGGQAQGGMMDSENWFSGTPSTERYYRRQYARQIDDRTRGGNPMARLFLRSGRTTVSPLDATPSGRAARGGFY